MSEIFNRLKKNPGLLFRLLIASLFVNILALATPIYVIQVLQRYVAYGVDSTLITLVAGISFIVIFEFFFRNIRHRMAREYEMSNVITVNNLLNKFSLVKSHIFETVTNFRNDIINKHLSIVQSVFSATTIITLIDVPFSLIFLIALFLIHYQLGLICLLFLFIPFLFNSIYRNRINLLSSHNDLINANIFRIFDNVITRNLTVKFFNLLKYINSSWNFVANNLANNKENFESEKNTLNSLSLTTGSFLTVAIIGWGATLSVAGEISVGALIGANILAARALMPINRFIQIQESLSRAENSSKEIKEYMNISSDDNLGREIGDLKGLISLTDLQFQYPSTKNPIFESLSLSVEPGQIVSLVGLNGSGKSTLIKILANILDISRGKYQIDDIDLGQLSKEWLRKQLIFSPQEPKFIDGTLKDNILGSNKINNVVLVKILKDVGLQSFINNHEKGIDMSLDDRGENLPLGIRKRISLARSMINDGHIVLLDEPTEGLDQIGKDLVINIIQDFKNRNKTIVIASNDQSIINLSDVLVDLNSKPKPTIVRAM
jgi:ATP-binding cassette subfamily C protein LapB